ncbi:MAG: hypothetical protein ABIQ11_04245 [Saprospiraceae bacterium]
MTDNTDNSNRKDRSVHNETYAGKENMPRMDPDDLVILEESPLVSVF